MHQGGRPAPLHVIGPYGPGWLPIWSCAVSPGLQSHVGGAEAFGGKGKGKGVSRVPICVGCARPLGVPPDPRALPASLPDPFKKRNVPRDIKETTAQLKQSVQAALQGRQSRMEIEMPIAAKFAVESGPLGKGRLPAMERSDRELARLFVEMFDPIGESVVLVFNENRLAKEAKRKWATTKGAIIALDSPTGKPAAKVCALCAGAF